MSFKGLSREGYADEPDAIYPVHERTEADGIFDSPTGKLLGWYIVFPGTLYAGSELMVGVSVGNPFAFLIAHTLFGS